MLFQDHEKSHIIIGEAALSLALCRKEISIANLFSQLGLMSKSENDIDRLTQIAKARNWLMSFESSSVAEEQIPYLQTLVSLNNELN